MRAHSHVVVSLLAQMPSALMSYLCLGICALFQFSFLVKASHLVNTTVQSTKYCKNREHAEGKWVFHGEPANKTFVCCGWDTSDWKDKEIQNFCRAEVQNQYEHKGNDTASHLNLVHSGGHACICDEFGNTRLVKSARERWTWVPNTCKLRNWNARLFCDLLADRTVSEIAFLL